jgi:hypothetical protein
MTIAFEITMLISSIFFYLMALGTKTEKQGYLCVTGGTVAAVLLLVALKML